MTMNDASSSAVPTPAPRLQPYTAKLVDRNVYNEKFQLLKLELIQPNKLQFTAGQYIIISVPGIAQRKSYSIASPPSVDHALDLLVDVTPQGPGSKYLQSSPIGTVMSFMAPVGGFTVPARTSPMGQEEDSLVFVATGSGIAPMKSMLTDLLVYQKDERPIILYWGLRFAEEQFWFEDFEEMARTHKNFTFHPILSRPPESWPLCRGRVTDCLGIHTLPERAGYFLCGNGDMIKDARALLMEKGVKPEHLHNESFHG